VKIFLSVICLMCCLPLAVLAQSSDARKVSGDRLNTPANYLNLQNTPSFPWQKKGELLLDKMTSQYKCSNLESNPVARAKTLLAKFELPRQGEFAARQALCRDVAKTFAQQLEKTNHILAAELSQAAEQNKSVISAMNNLSSCPGNINSETRLRLLKYLSIAIPQQFDKRRNVSIPPKVPLTQFYSQMREAVHIEQLVKVEEQAFVMERRYGLNTTKLTSKICPPQSSCSDQSRAPNIPYTLEKRYTELSKIDVPLMPRGQIVSMLNNEVTQNLNGAAARFNSFLENKVIASQALTPGSQFITRPKRGQLDDASQGVQNYYETFDTILTSPDGRLLEQDPFKAQLNGMFTFTGEDINKGKGASDGWQPLPQNFHIKGSSDDVVTAANGVLKGLVKYTDELNSRDDYARRGEWKAKDAFIDGTIIGKDQNLVNLSVLAGIAPAGFAQVIADFPEVTNNGQLCAVLNINEQFEKKIELVAEERKILGEASFAVGLTAMAVPSLQPVGAAFMYLGIGVGGYSGVDSYLAMETAKSAFMASGDASFRVDAQKYSEEMVSSFSQVATDGAGIAVMKMASKGLSASRLKKLGEVAEEAKNIKVANGSLHMNELPPTAQAKLFQDFDAAELKNLEENANRLPSRWKKISERVKRAFSCQ
jgi:hypothetical protein